MLQQLGYASLGGAIASVVIGELITSAAATTEERKKREFSQSLADKDTATRELQKTVDKLLIEADNFKALKTTLSGQIEKSEKLLHQRDGELRAARIEIGNLKHKLQEVGRFSASEAYQIVRTTYSRSVKKLESLLDALVRNYPDVREELDQVYIDVDSLRVRFSLSIEAYEQLQSFDELLDVGLEIQELIIDRCVELKVKAQTIVIRYLDEIVNDSVPFSDYETHIHNLTAKAAEEVQKREEEHRLNQQSLAQEWVTANNQHIENYQTEFTDVLNTAKISVGRLQEFEKTIEQLTNRIQELEKPIEWRIAVHDAQRVGNTIIRFFAAQGIRLDRSHIDNDPYEPILYFHVNRLDDVVVADDLNKFSQILQQYCELVLEPVHFTYNGELGLMQTKVKLAKKPKPTKEELSARIPDCKSLVSKARRGFLITGHPGAGKTSAMKAIAQWLGGEDAMRLALNPHSDEKSDFSDAGFVEINEMEEIYSAIEELDEELRLRGGDASRRQTLIIAIDELGRILKDAPSDLDVMEIVKQAAVEGDALIYTKRATLLAYCLAD